jgi:hypothetical protein
MTDVILSEAKDPRASVPLSFSKTKPAPSSRTWRFKLLLADD